MAILSRAHEKSSQPFSPTIHAATWITREKSRLDLHTSTNFFSDSLLSAFEEESDKRQT
jgi:ribosomal protein L28